MRTITYLSVLMYVLLNTTLIFSQDYIKFPEEGASWTLKSIDCGSNNCEPAYSNWNYDGDTIINGFKYSIIDNYLFVRDTNKIIYLTGFGVDKKDSLILYDFNLGVSDTFNISKFDILYHDYLIVRNIDSILIENNYRTRIKLVSDPFDIFIDTLTWIEGIGCNYGPIYYRTFPDFERTYTLTCYKKNDINIYGECVKVGINAEPTRFELPLVKPNPVSDYSILNPGTKKEYILEIYSSSGILQKKEKITGKYIIRRSDFNQGIYKYMIIYMGTFYSGSFVIL